MFALRAIQLGSVSAGSTEIAAGIRSMQISIHLNLLRKWALSYLNVKPWQEDTRGFVLAAIALPLSATALNTLPIVGTAISFVLPFVVAFVAAAMIVVAFIELFQTARR